MCGGSLVCVKDERGSHFSGLGQCHPGFSEDNRNGTMGKTGRLYYTDLQTTCRETDDFIPNLYVRN